MSQPLSPCSPHRSACQAALDRIATTVSVAQALAASARPVMLSGLDREMGRVCAQLLDLPPEDGMALRPILIALETRISSLTEAVRRQRPIPSHQAKGLIDEHHP